MTNPAFVDLIEALERSPAANLRVKALARFFRDAEPAPSSWAVTWLIGKARRLVTTAELQDWACEVSGTPEWLWRECQSTVGNVAETAAKLCALDAESRVDIVESYRELLSADDRKATVLQFWSKSNEPTAYVWNKLVTGGLRVNKVSHLVCQALADVYGLPATVLAERLMAEPEPTAEWFLKLVAPGPDDHISMPFMMPIALTGSPHTLGPAAKWMAHRMTSGRRCQLFKRPDKTLLWSQEGEALQHTNTIQVPCVLDGIQAANGDFHALDLLELEMEDLRTLPLSERRRRLLAVLKGSGISEVPVIPFTEWPELEDAHGSSGILLRRTDSPYLGVQPSQAWRLWPCARISVQAILMYAHRGEGSRYTSLTFGLLREGEVVSICKTMEGLNRRELDDLFAWIKSNTLERIGPVRTVPPSQAFELQLERVEPSSRHKCGFLVHGPRIVAWRRDLTFQDIDLVEKLTSI